MRIRHTSQVESDLIRPATTVGRHDACSVTHSRAGISDWVGKVDDDLIGISCAAAAAFNSDQAGERQGNGLIARWAMCLV